MVWVVTLMILVGMAQLLASLPAITIILSTLETGSLCRHWHWLRGLIWLFVVGYAMFALLQLETAPSTATMIVSLILMAGGSFVMMVARLSAMTARDIVRIAGLEHEANRDPLTGLFNRRHFDNRLNEEILKSRRSGCPLSAFIVDLDHFKHINDTYGHPVGDMVIRHVTALINGHVRTGNVVARYGGEEFAIIAPDCTSADANVLGHRILHAIATREISLPNGTSLAVTASIGAATLDTQDTQLQFVTRADEALYVAKRSGRNRLCMATVAPDLGCVAV